MAHIQLAHGVEPDDPVGTGTDLARFLGNSEFTHLLMQLIAKADPGNFGRLLRTWPEETITWQLWSALDDVPTASELARLRAKIWPNPPGRPMPAREEIWSLAREYNHGREAGT